MRRWFYVVGSIAVILAGILAWESVFPRRAESAVQFIENSGYSKVAVTGTRRFCAQNRKLFQFRGLRSDGTPVKGRLCLDLIRWNSTIDARAG